MIVGYARVSTDGQTLDAQQSALTQAGAEKVFAEKVSGAVTDRKQLGKAIAALSAGDVLLVTRLDRLARSTRDLLNVLDAVAKAEAGRTSEGRTRAKARGVKFGRKLALTPHQRSEALARRTAGESLVEIARSYAVSHSTISRLAPTMMES
jgi:DNA invertase Pin-like site-specific DNA recombinase